MAIVKSLGITLKQGATAIGQVVSLNGPQVTAETIDVTVLGDAYRKFLAGINDSGEVSGTVFFDPDNATHISLMTLIDDQVTSGDAANLTPETWVLTFTDATPATYSFSGVLTNWGPDSMEIGSAVQANFTIKVSGKITVA